MFVPLWLFDKNGGFSVNADEISVIQVREIPNSNPISYGYEVRFRDGTGYILPALRFDDREKAIANLEQLTNGLYQRFQLAITNSVASAIYTALKKLDVEEKSFMENLLNDEEVDNEHPVDKSTMEAETKDSDSDLSETEAVEAEVVE